MRQVSGKVGLDDFEILRIIGRGAYGKVSLVRHTATRRLYALKSMSKRLLAKGNNIQQTLVERELLLRNEPPFLVSARFAFQSEVKVFMVLDHVPGGEVFRRLKRDQRFTEERARLYAAEILLGLEHLHGLGVVYRDMKPENTLVDHAGHVRTTGFGFAKPNIRNEGQTTRSFCGTVEYLAPEVLQQRPYTRAVDWWSFGVIVFEMIAGMQPFCGSNRARLIRGILLEPVEFPFFFNSVPVNLIRGLLQKDPRRRLGAGPGDANEIRGHRISAGIDWGEVLTKRTASEWVPQIASDTDTPHFDMQFTDELPGVSPKDPALVPLAAQAAFENFTCDQEESVIDCD